MTFTKLMATALASCVMLCAADAAALRWQVALHADEASSPSDDIRYYYPFRTSYRQVDERYAFDDDPLSAFSNEPYEWHIELRRTEVRRGMVNPRTSFVPEMFKSTEAL